MKLSVIVLVGALAGSSAAFAQQSGATSTTTTAQDRALDSRVTKRLHGDPSLKKYDIKVKVESGTATLSGTVATEADRTRAGELAAKVAGVTRVDNKIVADLEAASKGTTGKIEDKAKAGAEKTKAGGEKVIDKSKEGLSKTGEVITDGWITSRIKTKFMGDESLRASDIKVDTDDHVVTLSGSVISPAAHAKAIADAKGVEGVHRVVDKLRIVPKNP